MSHPKRIMVVGNGGRECALASALLESPQVERLIITPPNWGVLDRQAGRISVLEIAATDVPALVAAAQTHEVELVVIGPEAALVAGLADALREAGIAAFGPGAAAARLEGSKQFAAEFMRRHGIKTADFTVFNDYAALCTYITEHDGPLVLKADGLAAGKGVFVCDNAGEALNAAERMMVAREFGASGDTVLAVKRLSGREISFTCLVASGRIELLPCCSDYKRLRDNDEGPNTGGMGNICPTPYASEEVVEEFCGQVLAPFIRGLRADGLDYRGFLFVGAMLTDEGLSVLEFNTRLGDPEAQTLLPLIEADWPALFYSIAAGKLPDHAVTLREGACVTVVLATANYPEGASRPAQIEGLERVHAQGLLDGDDPPLRIHFAGVTREVEASVNGPDSALYTNYYEPHEGVRFLATGGRVLAVSARASDLSFARRLAYEVVGNLNFTGMQYRGDIGKLR